MMARLVGDVNGESTETRGRVHFMFVGRLLWSVPGSVISTGGLP